MGLPVAVALTGGKVSDLKGYYPVMEADGPAPKVLLVDKGYDADFIRLVMERRGGFAMIPTKRNLLVQIPVDAAIYALRNMVERCFNGRMPGVSLSDTTKPPTAILASSIVSIQLWMRHFVNTPWPFAILPLGQSTRLSQFCATAKYIWCETLRVARILEGSVLGLDVHADCDSTAAFRIQRCLNRASWSN